MKYINFKITATTLTFYQIWCTDFLGVSGNVLSISDPVCTACGWRQEKARHGSLRPHLFFILVCETIGTAVTPGLLCQPRVIVKMIVEQQMECRLAGETEVLGVNLPQRHFCPSQNAT
jgi:hypothetical protein